KAGLAAGGASLFAKSMIANLAKANTALGDAAFPTPADSHLPRGPALAPWRSELPVQTPKTEVPASELAAFQQSIDPAAHQRYFEFEPRHFYEMHVQETTHDFHPDLAPARVFGYDGVVPGPLFVSRVGSPVLVRIHNDLPANHTGFGVPEVITHLHNG